jgi:hypothetical protein
VLLLSVGVSQKNVVEDHQLTNKLLPAPTAPAGSTLSTESHSTAVSLIARLPADVRLALWRADGEYLQAALNSINREYHSIRGYLTGGIGLSEAEIRKVRQVMTD